MIIERWPRQKSWIADRSQQGWRRGHKTVVIGPLQANWYDGWRLYMTWPIPIVIRRSR